MENHDIIYGTETSVHGKTDHILSASERFGHVFVCGTSQRFKHALLWNMMLQDIEAGAGVALIDSTGSFADDLLNHIPAYRANDTYVFAPDDAEYVVGFNPFRGVPMHERARATQEITALFKEVWNLDYERTPLLLDILRATARVLFDFPHSSFLSMFQVLRDKSYRQWVVSHCTDPIALAFWDDFERWPAKDQRDKPQPVMTRLRAFLSDPNLRNVLGQVRGALDIERIVRGGQVFIADVSQRKLGFETSMLLGCLLGSRFKVALSAGMLEQPFFLYVPDCDTFNASMFSRLFTGTGECGASVTLSTQQVAHFDIETRGALLRAETLLTFRASTDDVRHLADRFALPNPEADLPNLGADRFASNLLQYEAEALEPIYAKSGSRAHILKRSRNVLAERRGVVERRIERFLSIQRKSP
jgi:hypothetical protein